MPYRTIEDSPDVTFGSVADFMKSSEVSRRVVVMDHGLPIDILIDDRGSDTTIVFFHAALGSKTLSLPVFSGRGVARGLDANCVYISDPSLALDPELRLAWYAGSSVQPELQQTLTRVVSHTNHLLKATKLVLFGSSGGGFAALYYASQFPNAVAVASNPQTSIRRYLSKEVLDYCHRAWGVPASKYDALDAVVARIDVVDLYSYPTSTAVIYLQNSHDANHVANHFSPFFDALYPGNVVYRAFENWGDGHVPPPKDVVIQALKFACDVNPGVVEPGVHDLFGAG